MSRLWLAALGAAIIACGDDDSSGGPNDIFPNVAGVYALQGEFDNLDPTTNFFLGSLAIEQESLESSLLTGTADITITSPSVPSGSSTITSAELLDASVSLAGEVVFSIEQGGVTWDFRGDRGGDVIEGDHTVTQGAQTLTGTWSAER
jgi:hypothetical protein